MPNFQTWEFPRSGSKAEGVEKKKKKEEKKKKVGENNGQLRFVRHHGWRTQAFPDQKVGNSNGQLLIATPLRVAHTNPPGPKNLPITVWYADNSHVIVWKILFILLH